MKYILLVGRILFSLIFLMAIFRNFSAGTIKNASEAGVPLASLALPLSGIMAYLVRLVLLSDIKQELEHGSLSCIFYQQLL